MTAVNSETAPQYITDASGVTAEQERVIANGMAMTRKLMKEKGLALTSPDLVRKHLAMKFAGLEREHFAVLFLDNQHRLIADETLFQGTIDGASVYPREVVKSALMHNAAAVILSHNHPSGIPEPSQSDRRITERLVEALKLVDVRVLDHVVVGDDLSVSFAERGWI